MGCGSSKGHNSKDGKRQYRMKMEPETTTTDLADRGEPEGEEKGVDFGRVKDPPMPPNQAAAHDGVNGVKVDPDKKAKDNNLPNMADMSFNDQQDAKVKATNKRVFRNK